MLGSSPCLIEVWWNEFGRIICLNVYNQSNDFAWQNAFTSMLKARTVSSEKSAHESRFKLGSYNSTLSNFSDDVTNEVKLHMPKTEGDSFETLVWAFHANAAEHNTVWYQW